MYIFSKLIIPTIKKKHFHLNDNFVVFYCESYGFDPLMKQQFLDYRNCFESEYIVCVLFMNIFKVSSHIGYIHIAADIFEKPYPCIISPY